jgi:hypothetical protein
MRHRIRNLIFATVLFAPATLFALQPCVSGIRIEGVVTDPTGALVPGAQVLAGNESAITDVAGHYVLSCVPTNSTTVTVQADGFAAATARVRNSTRGVARLNVQMALAQVQTDVQVGEFILACERLGVPNYALFDVTWTAIRIEGSLNYTTECPVAAVRISEGLSQGMTWIEGLEYVIRCSRGR